MAQTIDLEAVIERAVKALVEAVDPEQIILFGSAARGEFGEGSDLDFLVVVPAEGVTGETSGRARRALHDLGVAKDIVLTTEQRLARYGDVRWTLEESALRKDAGCMPDPEVLYEASLVWLQWATTDLRASEALRADDDLQSIVAYHAQQAAEKALKGMCLYVQAPFVKTHDFNVLFGLIESETHAFGTAWRHVASLTDYCFAGRYPGSGRTITAADALAACDLAGEFVRAARQWVEQRHRADTQS